MSTAVGQQAFWRQVRPVALVWSLLAAIQICLLLKASLASPPGTTFVGTFFYVPDFYNYLSYVQQAEAGAVLFRNKLADPSLPAVLFNLEWLLVGWLSRLLGGAPIVAYHALGLAALGANVVLVDRWLLRAGLPSPQRLTGLLLVFTGGGLGGILAFWFPEAASRYAFDLFAGFYPFLETIANPHFVIGTTLLVATLSAFALRRTGWGILLGSALALARPYDAAIACAVEGLAVLVLAPPRAWPRRLLAVAALLPALGYDAWVFLAREEFRSFASGFWEVFHPSTLALMVSIGPAILIAATVLRLRHARADEATRHRLYLGLWIAVALLMEILRPVSFALQFTAGIGLPLLGLGAIGLSALRRGILELAVPFYALSAIVLTGLYALPKPYLNVPSSRWGAAATLRVLCRPGQIALAPQDVEVYVSGLTACRPFTFYAATPDYARKEAERQRFEIASDAERAAFLERECITYVVTPAVWRNGGLPPSAPYRLAARTPGTEPLAIYARRPHVPCARPRP